MAQTELTQGDKSDLKRFAIQIAERLCPFQSVSTQGGVEQKKDVDAVITDAEKIFNFLIK